MPERAILTVRPIVCDLKLGDSAVFTPLRAESGSCPPQWGLRASILWVAGNGCRFFRCLLSAVSNPRMENTIRKIKQCLHCKLEVDYQASRCPHCSGKIYVWTLGRKLVASGVGVLCLFAAIGAAQFNSEPAPIAHVMAAPAVRAFDVPSLVGKDIHEIRVVLGTPTWDVEPTPLQIESGTKEWNKNYERKGITLSITYSIATGKVIELFVEKQSENASDILAAGNLSQNDSRYSVELIKSVNASGYTGAVVKAK